MCDETSLDEAEKWLSRRQAGQLAARMAGGVVAASAVGGLLSGCAEANAPSTEGDAGAESGSADSMSELPAGLSEADVLIATPDGQADAYWVHPAEGTAPAVVIWPDIFGLRPAFRSMARKLASEGYAVLAVHPYYRTQKGDVLPAGDDASSDGVFGVVRPLANTLSVATTLTDAKAYADWLAQQDAVDASKQMGTMGFCMTGSYVFRAAAAMPDRIGAGASFHGGGLVTDAPDSPHRLIPQIDAAMLVAIAENDDAKEPEADDTLKKAFADAGVTAELEVYPAMHGWVPIDTKAYNPEQAEKAWNRMLAMFGPALKGA